MRLLVVAVVASLLLTACDFTPKGATVFKINSVKEFDKAQLNFPPTEGERRMPLKLRWADTNTWLTTATLAPGKYAFNARTHEGAFFAQEVQLVPGKTRYEMTQTRGESPTVAVGPKISGTVSLPPNVKLPGQVVVIFIGQDVNVRRVPLEVGRFSADVPVPGRYRVEVHTLGEKPLSFSSQLLDIAADTDLKTIYLK